jgi:hypothetical protein
MSGSSKNFRSRKPNHRPFPESLTKVSPDGNSIAIKVSPGGAVLCKAPGKAEAKREVKALGADTTKLSAPRPWG